MQHEYWKHYLAGFWEGDGHCARPGKQPYVAFTFHKKNRPLVFFFQKALGGNMREKANALVLTLYKKKLILDFFVLVYENLRTPKAKKLKALIEESWPEYMFIIKQSKTISLSESAWLAGFIDADGGFKIRCTFEKKDNKGRVLQKKRLGLSFALEQRKQELESGRKSFFHEENSRFF